MSNPTTLVFPLADSLNGTDQSGSVALTGVDPIRYDGGLWLEEGTTNYACVPQGGTPSLFIALRSTLTTDSAVYYSGTSSLKSTRSSGPGSSGWQVKGGSSVAVPVNPSEAWTLSAYGRSDDSVSLRLGADIKNGADGAGSLVSSPTLALEPVTTDWERLVLTTTMPASAASMQPFLYDQSASANGARFQSDQIQFELKLYATSAADGSMGSGYAWTGTPGQSTSTRAASSASVATANHIDPFSGALAFRLTRKIDTGGTETILECGTDGAGTDYLSIYVNSSDKLVVSWKSNGAAAQTVTSTGSIAVDTEYLVITKWNGTSVSLSLNVGTPDTGTRDAVQGSWGAGALKLEASAGGAIFNGLLVANRPTKQTEDAALYNRPTWSARTLRDRIAIGAMQLRPIGA